ncbi:MAG: hypothetical protein DHS80DRAFT_25264 [Piptocephalis tieghemiana]|nr:MAG: hypothetical protein DHS80DRAFT_25264 [Piptocephalis tieghemiana]
MIPPSISHPNSKDTAMYTHHSPTTLPSSTPSLDHHPGEGTSSSSSIPTPATSSNVIYPHLSLLLNPDPKEPSSPPIPSPNGSSPSSSSSSTAPILSPWPRPVIQLPHHPPSHRVTIPPSVDSAPPVLSARPISLPIQANMPHPPLHPPLDPPVHPSPPPPHPYTHSKRPHSACSSSSDRSISSRSSTRSHLSDRSLTHHSPPLQEDPSSPLGPSLPTLLREARDEVVGPCGPSSLPIPPLSSSSTATTTSSSSSIPTNHMNININNDIPFMPRTGSSITTLTQHDSMACMPPPSSSSSSSPPSSSIIPVSITMAVPPKHYQSAPLAPISTLPAPFLPINPSLPTSAMTRSPLYPCIEKPPLGIPFHLRPPAPRPRRSKRRKYTIEQLSILTAAFSKDNATPSLDQRITLGDQCGITERDVQIWYQNRRAKEAKVAIMRKKATRRRLRLQGEKDQGKVTSDNPIQPEVEKMEQQQQQQQQQQDIPTSLPSPIPSSLPTPVKATSPESLPKEKFEGMGIGQESERDSGIEASSIDSTPSSMDGVSTTSGDKAPSSSVSSPSIETSSFLNKSPHPKGKFHADVEPRWLGTSSSSSTTTTPGTTEKESGYMGDHEGGGAQKDRAPFREGMTTQASSGNDAGGSRRDINGSSVASSSSSPYLSSPSPSSESSFHPGANSSESAPTSRRRQDKGKKPSIPLGGLMKRTCSSYDPHGPRSSSTTSTVASYDTKDQGLPLTHSSSTIRRSYIVQGPSSREKRSLDPDPQKDTVTRAPGRGARSEEEERKKRKRRKARRKSRNAIQAHHHYHHYVHHHHHHYHLHPPMIPTSSSSPSSSSSSPPDPASIIPIIHGLPEGSWKWVSKEKDYHTPKITPSSSLPPLSMPVGQRVGSSTEATTHPQEETGRGERLKGSMDPAPKSPSRTLLWVMRGQEAQGEEGMEDSPTPTRQSEVAGSPRSMVKESEDMEEEEKQEETSSRWR